MTQGKALLSTFIIHKLYQCCAGVERTGFPLFPSWEDVVVLKGLIFNNFYFLRVCGIEGTDFVQFSLWRNVAVLKALILGGCDVLKGLILDNFDFGLLADFALPNHCL